MQGRHKVSLRDMQGTSPFFIFLPIMVLPSISLCNVYHFSYHPAEAIDNGGSLRFPIGELVHSSRHIYCRNCFRSCEFGVRACSEYQMPRSQSVGAVKFDFFFFFFLPALMVFSFVCFNFTACGINKAVCILSTTIKQTMPTGTSNL
jgi:hypothetical protein